MNARYLRALPCLVSCGLSLAVERCDSVATRLRATFEGVAESACLGDGRYWARTSDPQLVELVLKVQFAALFFAVGKDLGKSDSGESGFRRPPADL